MDLKLGTVVRPSNQGRVGALIGSNGKMADGTAESGAAGGHRLVMTSTEPRRRSLRQMLGKRDKLQSPASGGSGFALILVFHRPGNNGDPPRD